MHNEIVPIRMNKNIKNKINTVNKKSRGINNNEINIMNDQN